MREAWPAASAPPPTRYCRDCQHNSTAVGSPAKHKSSQSKPNPGKTEPLEATDLDRQQDLLHYTAIQGAGMDQRVHLRRRGGSTRHALQRSPLLQLPGDIRNIIWDFVFRHDMHVNFDEAIRRTNSRSIFALSRTCREIYNETRDLPFWLNTVHFHVPVVQDLSVVRSHRYQNSAPAPLYSWSRLSQVPYSGNLASRDVAVRQKAQEHITECMRLPNVGPIMTRLWDVLSRPAVLRRLRRVHVHLGFQTNNVFVERFYTAWAEVLPYLRLLRDHTDLRVSFQLRLSRKLVVDYDFVLDAEAMLQQMNQCVPVDAALSLPEMASVNAVRSRVWNDMFGARKIGGSP